MTGEKFSGSFHASSLLRRSDLVRMTGVELIARTKGIASSKTLQAGVLADASSLLCCLNLVRMTGVDRPDQGNRVFRKLFKTASLETRSYSCVARTSHAALQSIQPLKRTSSHRQECLRPSRRNRVCWGPRCRCHKIQFILQPRNSSRLKSTASGDRKNNFARRFLLTWKRTNGKVKHFPPSEGPLCGEGL